MSKILKLANGREITATVSSTITEIEIPVESFGEVDGLVELLTPTNLSTVQFDGRTYRELALIGASAETTGGRLFATVLLELCVEDRIEDAKQQAVDAYTLQLIEEGLL